MATMQTAIKTLLEDDATLAALLTGGIYFGEDLDANGWSYDDLPKESNGVRIKPVGVLRFKSLNAYGPRGVKAERGSVEVYCYAGWGYEVIDSAISRIKVLLDRHFEWGTDNRNLAHFVFTYVSAEEHDDEFGGLPMQFVRFQLTQTRS